MIELISLDEAREHVRVASTAFDSDIQFKILQATAIVLNYLKVPMDAAINDSPVTLPWTSEEPPYAVKAAAMLCLLGSLAASRGITDLRVQRIRSALACRAFTIASIPRSIDGMKKGGTGVTTLPFLTFNQAPQ